ncbi:MAG: dienelactone hydrolase family protein [Pseudomonadota bacterium]|nr:dienelactone hydrolase family protein [Pseudomonadota bacterium]
MRAFSIALFAGVLTAIPLAATAMPTQDGVDCMAPEAPPQATVERTTFQSRGREIQGLLYKPARPNGAAIVLLHDREGIQEDLARYEAQLGRLASCGYTVIAPSYYDAAGPRSRNDPLLGQKWDQVVDEAIVKVGSVNGVDPARVGVWGHGRGGNLALNNAMEGTAARAVVAVAAGGRVERSRESPPILLIAGDHSLVAPIYTSEELARTLRQLGLDVTVESVPSSAREFEPEAWDAVFARTRAFFDTRLAPAG